MSNRPGTGRESHDAEIVLSNRHGRLSMADLRPRAGSTQTTCKQCMGLTRLGTTRGHEPSAVTRTRDLAGNRAPLNPRQSPKAAHTGATVTRLT